MSVKLIARVWAHSQRKDGELLVMLALADFANDAGESWPSIPVLAAKARLTDRQARRVLIKLEQAGEIRCVKSNGGRNRRNHYFICLSENPDNITLTKLQGKNNTVTSDRKTLTSTPGALIRHRSVNKKDATEPTDSLSTKSKRKLTRSDPVAPQAFERFYQAFPKHVGRHDALKAWLKLKPDDGLIAVIMAAVERYAAEVRDTTPKFILHPATWLNGRRWEDEPANGNGNGHVKPVQVKDLGNGMLEVDGRVMDQRTYERRHGQTAT
jgi:hypothetical protein